jgi:hypothetical protein
MIRSATARLEGETVPQKWLVTILREAAVGVVALVSPRAVRRRGLPPRPSVLPRFPLVVL